MSLDLTKRKPKGDIVLLSADELLDILKAMNLAGEHGIASFHFPVDGSDLKVLYDEEEDRHYLVLQPVD